MRKTVIAGLLGSAFALAGTAQASLVIDLNGLLGGTDDRISATALDWSQTSFLAKGGNAAIDNFTRDRCTPGNEALCDFTVFTHARLTGYTPATGPNVGEETTIPGGFGEITMVASFTERVFGAGIDTITGRPTAAFSSTGAGWLEFYWSPPTAFGDSDARALTGFNFNNGTLIGRLTGVTPGAVGSFTVNPRVPPVALDRAGGNDYSDQLSVTGTGTNDPLIAGTTGIDLDSNFFIGSVAGFKITFQNFSIQAPFGTTNPSNCFNPDRPLTAVGTTGLSSICNNDHINGLMSAQPGSQYGGGGIRAVIGGVNGVGGAESPDFMGQTDINAAVFIEEQEIPEPGTLALVGLALAGMGVGAIARRRRA